MTTRQLAMAVGAAAALVTAGCANLDISNPNNPDVERATATADDVKGLAVSSVNSWYLTSTERDPYMGLEVTSDRLTGNFGNFAMRFNNVEPRIPYANNSANADAPMAVVPWDNNYGTLGIANDVLRAVARGLVLTNAAETERHKHLAQFTQAASLMNLALTFDSAFVVDEASTGTPVLQGYAAVTTATLAKWDALIAGTAGKSYTYGQEVIPVTSFELNSASLNKIANTMAAITTAYSARTPQQWAAVNWGKVLQYANAGIDFDVVVQGDNNNWWSYINFYGNEPSWLRVDMRLICRMDPTQDCTYAGASSLRAPAATADARVLGTTPDYQYHGTVIGDAGRGVYMQSPWSHRRYRGHARTSTTAARTAVPYILKAENDLLIAEALVRTNGDKARAATLVNNTRVTRGQRTPLTAASTNAEFFEAIDYERDVELTNTNAFGFFWRRSSSVQPLRTGTIRHLPVPAKELETLGKPVYTYGGETANPTGLLVVELPSGERVALRRAAKPRALERFLLPQY